MKQNISLRRNSNGKRQFSRMKSTCTSSTVSKVVCAVDVEGPRSQHTLTKLFHTTQSTISRIIKCFDFTLRKILESRNLTVANANKRHREAGPLHRRLANQRYKNFNTTDES
jgi:hypothetical protein